MGMILVFTTLIVFFTFFFWTVERMRKNAEKESTEEVKHAVSWPKSVEGNFLLVINHLGTIPAI